MPLNEQIVTGRSFRKCIDVTNKLWQKISFWSKASDVEFDDGENAETKLGAIKGITTDLNITETGYAADMTALAQLNSEITPVTKTNMDDVLEYLVPGLQYTYAIFTRFGPIVHVKLHGTCPYELGVNTYARIKDPVFIPQKEEKVVAAFASGTAKNGTGILQISPDGSVNIIATEAGLNWIFADVFYII